jgi:hypothetical protein
MGELVMARRNRARRLCLTLLAGMAACGAVPASGSAALKLIAPTYYATDPGMVFERTADGKLHLVYPTRGNTGGNNGIATTVISTTGTVGAKVQALSNWGVSRPGFTVLPNGELFVPFGATPGGSNPDGPWAIFSTNGGATWTAPSFIGSKSSLEAQSYVGDYNANVLGSTPWMTINIGGGLVLQQGFGPTAPTTAVGFSSTDGVVGDVETAIDAASGELVASWASIANPGGDFMQGIAPSVQAAHKVAGQRRNAVEIAARSKGAGVYGAYTPDNTHVRLYRYGGGSVAVGSSKGLTAQIMGVATGTDGRIWVMWGDDSLQKVAITRSNRAVTRFGPVQLIKDKASGLDRLFGDGRLGPLDLFIDEQQTPPKNQQVFEGVYYTRILPKLSATASVHRLSKHKFKLTVKVTDAGDALSGAKVSSGSSSAKTSAKGIAHLTVHGTAGSKVSVKVSDGGYTGLSFKVKL